MENNLEQQMVEEYNHSKGFAVLVFFLASAAFIVVVAGITFVVTAGINSLYEILSK